MSYGALLLMAIVALLIAVYAQWSVPRVTRPAFIWPLRLLLAGVGVAVGYALAATSELTADEPHFALILLIGFGLVHAPAAAILGLKQARGSRRT